MLYNIIERKALERAQSHLGGRIATNKYVSN